MALCQFMKGAFTVMSIAMDAGHILIAEDDSAINDLMAEILRRNGYMTVICSFLHNLQPLAIILR